MVSSRLLLPVAALALSACLQPTSGTASPDAADVTAAEATVVTITDQSWIACRCHHGFGPGVDGTVTIHVAPPSGVSVDFRLVSVRWDPHPDTGPGGDGFVIDQTANGYWRVPGLQVNRVGLQTVSATLDGPTTFTAELYLDLLDEPPAGDYVVTYQFEIDGIALPPVVSDRVVVDDGPTFRF